MDFYEELFSKDLSYLLESVEYHKPVFKNEAKFLRFMTQCIKENAKTLVYGDYDIDGLMSLSIVKDTLKYIGHTNFDVFRYINRTHDLDTMAVAQAISGRYKYMIICDTASSDMNSINRLIRSGVTPIIIDHHISEYNYDDYPEECCFINSMTENKECITNLKTSAGALTFMLMDSFIKYLKLDAYESLSAYALVSLYSDCMDMSNQFNRGIYYRARRLERHQLPSCIGYFMNEFIEFNRRFIEFHFAPKINAIFRSETLDLVNKLFLTDNLSLMDIEVILNDIDLLHKSIRQMVSVATDIIEYKVMNNFVIGNLSSVDPDLNVEDNKLYNYTGLVANMLADRYGKTAVVYCHCSDGSLKASLRDQQSRAYLPVFKQFCRAGGHNSAFGIHLTYFEFNNFIDCIERIDKNYALETIPNEPIIIKHEKLEPDLRLICDMAIYNEFSGSTIPTAFIQHKILPTFKEMRNQYSFKYKWGSSIIQSNNRLRYFSEFLAKPTKCKGVKLMV